MKDVDRIQIRKVYAICPGWPPGGSKEFSSQTQIYAIPCRLQLPTNKWRSAGPARSLYLLSITGLAALGAQYHSLSGTEFSASKGVTCLLPATQADSHAGSKVYIWNVFGAIPPPHPLASPPPEIKWERWAHWHGFWYLPKRTWLTDVRPSKKDRDSGSASFIYPHQG